MDVREAIASRFSCRGFLPIPVPLATVRDILDRAARSPSGGNLQPWCVHALAGARARRTQAAGAPACRGQSARRGRRIPNLSRAPQGTLSHPSFRGRRAALWRNRHRRRRPGRPVPPICPQFRVLRRAGRPILFARPHHGAAAMGRPRHVRPCRDAAGACSRPAYMRHRSMDALAQDRGGLSRPSRDQILFCGMALGHAEETAPINGWRSSRVGVDAFAAFAGFPPSAAGRRKLMSISPSRRH